MSVDRPDAEELVGAVAQWLASDLAPGLEAGPRFQAMVAAQGLAIAARELALGHEHEALDREQLGALLADRRESEDVVAALATAIAAGDFDERLDAVAVVLGEHVKRKLAIARPGYDEPAHPTSS